MTAYYNENDPFAAAWLRNLIAAGLIAPGDVDERSILDVQPDDLRGYAQHHFFAGIGGWSLALRAARWPDDRPVWTGSCPCQPFSAAGKRKGAADERHLWPEFRRLIAERAPAAVFGEQVASKDGRDWLAGVRTDLEGMGYAVGAADLCAASCGAPHIRQRLWWVADADGRLAGNGYLQSGRQHGQQPQDGGAGERMAHSDIGPGRQGRAHGSRGDQGSEAPERCGSGSDGIAGGLVGVAQPGPQGRGLGPDQRADQLSPWASGVFIPCADGKARRIEPGIQPLVTGLPLAMDGRGPISRIGVLRGAGNAIVPQVAAQFIASYAETRGFVLTPLSHLSHERKTA